MPKTQVGSTTPRVGFIGFSLFAIEALAPGQGQESVEAQYPQAKGEGELILAKVVVYFFHLFLIQ